MKQFLGIVFPFVIAMSNNILSFTDEKKQDEVFVNWNKLTVESIEGQWNLTNDSLQKSFYKNRILSLKAFFEIKSVADINRNSIRYLFLKELFSINKASKNDYFVIEANRSGESVLLRNFVVYIDSNKKAVIDMYSFSDNKWRKIGKVVKNNFAFDHPLNKHITKFNTGFNHDDIIISRFSGQSVKESEFFLVTTLNVESRINEIIELYQKANIQNSKMK